MPEPTYGDAVEPDPRVGTLVAGRYRIEALLARGGMGVVYRAIQEPLGRRVALKLIRGDALDDVARGRFLREAQLVSTLSDPRIVTVHDFGDMGDGTLFLVMELLRGQTLRERLRRGPLTWRELEPIVHAVAAALACAHAARVVHRDLKPDNVLLVDTPDGAHVKVVDFGLAKESDALLTGAPTLTRSGGLVGTPGYIAPEAISGAGESPRFDVYALGVMIWECLAGRHPFAAETPLRSIVRATQEDVPELAEGTRIAQGAPPGLNRTLALLTARDPAQRAADGAAALAALRGMAAPGSPDESAQPATVSIDFLPAGAIVKSSDGAPPWPPAPSAPSAASGATPPRSSRARPTLVAAAGALALAIALVTTLFVATRPRPRPPATEGHLLSAAAELASGNAVIARSHVRRAVEIDDGPRARALWAAATHEPHLLDVAVDGRATGVVFLDEGHLVISNRNRSLERYDLRTGERHRELEFDDELIDVDAAGAGLASCDLRGNVRWRGSHGERTLQLPALACRAVAVGPQTVWAIGGGAELFRWQSSGLSTIPIGIAPIAVASIDDTRVVVAGRNDVDVVSLRGDQVTQQVGAIPEVPVNLVVAGTGTMYLGGAQGGIYRSVIDDDGRWHHTLLRRHGARAEALAVSPDDTLLASAGADEIVRVGPIGAPPDVALVDGPHAPIALAFSPSGRLLAALARNRLVVIDIAMARAEAAPRHHHTGSVEALAVHGDDVWSGGSDGRVLRWSLSRGRAAPLFQLGARVEDLDLAADGRTLAVALGDGRVTLLDAVDGRTVGGWYHPGGATGVRFSPEGARVVSVGRDGRAMEARVTELVPTVLLPPADPPLSLLSVAVRADGAVAVGGYAGAALLVRRDRPAVPLPSASRGCGSNFSMRFRGDGRVLSACNDNLLLAIDVDGTGAAEQVTIPTRIYDIDVQGDRLVVGGHAGAFQTTSAPPRRLAGPDAVNRVRLIGDGVVLGADDGTVRFASLEGRAHAFDLDLTALGELEASALLADVGRADRGDDGICALHAGGVSQWRADGALRGTAMVPVASDVAGTGDACAALLAGEVRIVADGAERARVPIDASAVADDGEAFIVATSTHLVWFDDRGHRRSELPLPAGAAVTAVAAGPRGVVVGRADGRVVSLARDGSVVRMLDGAPVSPVRRLAVADDDGTIAAGTESGDVLSWLPNGELLDVARLHGPIGWLRFAADGLHIATVVGDRAVRQTSRSTPRCELLREVADATGAPLAGGQGCGP